MCLNHELLSFKTFLWIFFSHGYHVIHFDLVWFGLVWFLFYGPSTHFRSFRAWSVNLATLFLGKPPRQFTSTWCTFFHQYWQLLFLTQQKRENSPVLFKGTYMIMVGNLPKWQIRQNFPCISFDRLKHKFSQFWLCLWPVFRQTWPSHKHFEKKSLFWMPTVCSIFTPIEAKYTHLDNSIPWYPLFDNSYNHE